MANQLEITVIDSHFHLWSLSLFRYSFPDARLPPIFRDFLPHHLQAAIGDGLYYPDEHKSGECSEMQIRLRFTSGVFVQVTTGEPKEADFIAGLAQEFPYIKGIVAWIDLTLSETAFNEELRRLKTFPLVKGFRHIVEGEDVDWLMREDVLKSFQAIEASGLTYDLLIRPRHFHEALLIVKMFPRLPFVLDHLGKPNIKTKEFIVWAEWMRKFGSYPNVYCKLSGMVTEADLDHWSSEDIRPYVEVALSTFGTNRLMYGSDWPVCILAKDLDYKGTAQLLLENLVSLGVTSKEELTSIFSENCRRFYRLDC